MTTRVAALLLFMLAVAMSLTGRAIAQTNTAPAGPGPLIAAASDLRFALDELAARYQQTTGQTARIVYGSSGNFRRQIAEGAPFEIFLSADEGYVLALAREGKLPDAGVPYATGRLALVLPRGSPLRLDGTLQDIALAARDGRLKRFAIANPEHAPYGRAAREALITAGAWDVVQSRLVLGENVSQAAQFATSGSAQGGLVALSLALASGALGDTAHVAIPEHMHRPLLQRMALTLHAGAAARAFYEYLQQPGSRAVLKRYGFVVPGG